MTLRDTLIARLGASEYDLLHASTADYLGLPPDCEPEFIDRVLADSLRNFDQPPMIGVCDE